MSPDVTDRRVRRTRDLLRKALVELIGEKGYHRVTVQDILDRADIGRSTFYAHYRDKDDLLRSGFDDVLAVLDTETGGDGGSPGALLQPLLAVFRHVEGYRQLWEPLARKGGLDLGLQILHEHTEKLLRLHLGAQFPRPADDRQLEAAVQFVTGALVGLLTWWVANDIGYSADGAHSIFCALAVPGLRQFFPAEMRPPGRPGPASPRTR